MTGHYGITGLRATKADLIAALLSDALQVSIITEEGAEFVLRVQSMKKVSGYFDFWQVCGYVGIASPAIPYVDYHEPEAAGHPKGGFGYLEIT